MTFERSEQAYRDAQTWLVGGVNSPVRAFRAVGGTPLFIERAAGARVWDIDGNEYIDYLGSWGPMILGHAHPVVTERLHAAVDRGTSYGTPTLVETELAELVCKMVPSVDMVRFVSSGTEATMSAIRLARAATGRKKIVKFIGCYHGHGDSLLSNAGSGVLTLGIPGSPGVTEGTAADTISVPFNDLKTIGSVFNEAGDDIAAVIVEPVAGNMGVIPPQDGFLQGLRDLTTKNDSLLIFDEVMTGFRVAAGGAQERYGVRPDLSCFGKVIGGGMPVGAIGGPKSLMEQYAPTGNVYQAGTLSGNPLAMTAGAATLQQLQDQAAYDKLEALSTRFAEGLQKSAEATGTNLTINGVGSMSTAFFTNQNVTSFESATSSNTELYGQFHQAMLKRGVYLAPSQFEAAFVSLAHTEEDIDRTIGLAEEALQEVANS